MDAPQSQKLKNILQPDKPATDLDLYVDPLDRPFIQLGHKLWDDHETSETGYPSDAYIRLFMSPPFSSDGDGEDNSEKVDF